MFLISVVVVLAAANLNRDPSGVKLDWRVIRPPAQEVEVEVPMRGTIVQTITAPGRVEAVEEAEIASQIVGRVVEVRVKDGSEVKKGDLLVLLDDREMKARYEAAMARIERAKAVIAQAVEEQAKAKRYMDQAERLADRGASTATALADARSDFAKAAATLEVGKRELAESESMKVTSLQNLEWTRILAPMDGVVANLNVEVGEVVIAGTTNLPGTVLMTVADLSRMQVRADVDETDVRLVRAGQKARVYLQADPAQSIPGIVEQVAPKGKKVEEVISFETLIRVEPEQEMIRPAMSATVEVEVKRAEEVLSLPVQAVVHRRRKDLPETPAVIAWTERHLREVGGKRKEAESRYVQIVFVVEQGVARARPVEVGISDERRVEILSGVEPDEQVIVGPFRALDELKDGTGVMISRARRGEFRSSP
jgi:HlyD family secretion protein